MLYYVASASTLYVKILDADTIVQYTVSTKKKEPATRTSDGNIANLPIFSGLSQLPWFLHTIIFGIFKKAHVL